MSTNLISETAGPVFDSREFRRALGCFPTGVAIITTRDAQGQPVGLTCNSFSSVSLDPPLVLWSLRTASKSLPAFRDNPSFAINVLADDQGDLSARFASSSIADKFEGVAHSEGYASVPLIDACVARFQCSVFAQHDAGDHVIFIGKVERFENEREEDPLVFYKGGYMMLAQSLRELSAKGRISPAELSQARAEIYAVLLRLGCANARAEDLDAIEANLARMDDYLATGDMAGRAYAALEFFRLITAAAHNDVLLIVAQSLNTLMHHAVTAKAAAVPWPALHQPELTPIRRRILDGLRARDAQAAVAALDDYVVLMPQYK